MARKTFVYLPLISLAVLVLLYLAVNTIVRRDWATAPGWLDGFWGGSILLLLAALARGVIDEMAARAERGRVRTLSQDSACPVPTDPDTLILSFGQATLDGIACGDSIDALVAFGAPERPLAGNAGELRFPALGLLVEVERWGVAYFGLVFRDGDCPGLSLARVMLADTSGPTCVLSSATTIEDIERLLGPPKSRDADGDETIDVYDVIEARDASRHMFEFEYVADGTLKRVNLFPAR